MIFGSLGGLLGALFFKKDGPPPPTPPIPQNPFGGTPFNPPPMPPAVRLWRSGLALARSSFNDVGGHRESGAT